MVRLKISEINYFMNTADFKYFLDSKNCFKIICGAGNQNYNEITNLCALYASLGCRFFDINASPEAIQAAKAGFKFVNKEKECFICVSVGTKNDPHFIKCDINQNTCSACGTCEKVCLQKAIRNENNKYYIEKDKCIGCQKCLEACKNSAINRHIDEMSLTDIIPPLLEEGFDCLEYHIITDSETDIMNGWNDILSMYNCPISVCLDRSKFGNEQVIKCLNKMKESYNGIFIVQADGAPMSGGKDDFRTTIQAVAMADIVDKANITPYIFVSGGTNSKTKELVKLCNIDITGIAIGSYARKIVKEYIENDHFLTDKEIFNKALDIAKSIL